MIFLTVGTQLPFDRLTRAMDDWCGEHARNIEVFGQIGAIGPNSYTPKNFEWVQKISPDEFTRRVKSATAVVGHAGMGSIITAMTFRKPTVIMARRAHLGEHRNDHQEATLQRFKSRGGLHAVSNTLELSQQLDAILAEGAQNSGNGVAPFAEERLIKRLSSFIHNG